MGKILLSILFLSLFACGNGGDDNNHNNNSNGQGSEPSTIIFFNGSSYKVDIYRNYNPAAYDSSSVLCSIDAGKNKVVGVPASSDDMMGDVFYTHYKILLANMYEAGKDVYINAQRDLSNMTFVVERGETYSKTIPQPSLGDLKFANGYIAVQNAGGSQISIKRGSSMLIMLNGDGGEVYIQPGKIGYYEIPISSYDKDVTMNQLSAFNTSDIDFPEFTVEQGKLYKFTVGASVSEPEVSNISIF